MPRAHHLLVALCGVATAAAQQPYPSTPAAQPTTQPAVTHQPRTAAAQPAVGQGPAQPPAPFTVSAEEQAYIDNLLLAWEQKSRQVKNFKGTFTRWKYTVFGPLPEYFSRSTGELRYRSPDRGSFEITESRVWKAGERKYKEQEDAVLEKWVCDGKSIYEFQPHEKKVVERPIPPGMQGQRIVDGPLPFLFGAEAAKLKARYWIRIDRKLSSQTQVGILAIPKYQRDAANYKAVQVAFDVKNEYLLPSGIIVYHPDNSRDSYLFDLENAQVNKQFGQLFERIFSAPRTPLGWKKVVEQPQTNPVRQAGGGQAAPR